MAACRNIVIFGATGMTGLATLAQALQAGYQVTVLVRDPARLPPEHRPARVVVGDVLNPADVDKAIEGQDAVIIILGTRNDLSPTTMMSEGTRNIVAAMKAHGIRKVVVCLSGESSGPRPELWGTSWVHAPASGSLGSWPASVGHAGAGFRLCPSTSCAALGPSCSLSTGGPCPAPRLWRRFLVQPLPALAAPVCQVLVPALGSAERWGRWEPWGPAGRKLVGETPWNWFSGRRSKPSGLVLGGETTEGAEQPHPAEHPGVGGYRRLPRRMVLDWPRHAAMPRGSLGGFPSWSFLPCQGGACSRGLLSPLPRVQ
uniref:Biliverdin reductase B n=1 Tax=Gopherus evgoodei TaxID=1825980 RepID=A0A8C4YN85_9SAUR